MTITGCVTHTKPVKREKIYDNTVWDAQKMAINFAERVCAFCHHHNDCSGDCLTELTDKTKTSLSCTGFVSTTETRTAANYEKQITDPVIRFQKDVCVMCKTFDADDPLCPHLQVTSHKDGSHTIYCDEGDAIPVLKHQTARKLQWALQLLKRK